ncbi:MAG: hypothetical protein QW051_02510 [Candidatus Aenigmatarchaeota archaeon]
MFLLSKNKLAIGLVSWLFLIIVISSFLLPNVEAIGLTPGRTTLDFEANAEKTITFTIINNEHKEFNAVVYAEDELKDYVGIEKNIIEFKETDNSKDFTLTFKMPERIDTPGDHWAKIIVMELPKETDIKKIEGQIVTATMAVIHQIKVKVPYEGKYINLETTIEEASPGGTVVFFVKIYNLGTEKIYKAKATVDILGPTNEKIDTIESESISVDSKSVGEVVLPWVANVNPGKYHAVITVNYDGNIAKTEKNFAVGALLIEVLDVKVRNFVLGEIAKFEISIENKWNEKIPNVYGEMIINNERGDTVAKLKSASVDIGPLQRSTLYIYWDTEGIEKGIYEARLVLHYAEKTSEKRIKTIVSLENIETEIIGITAKAVTAKGGVGPGVDLLVPLVIILIFINVGWFFYLRRRKR